MLTAKIQEGIYSTRASYMKLQVLINQFIEKPESADKVRLPHAIRADEYVKRPKIQGHLSNRLEAAYFNSVQTAHSALNPDLLRRR